MLFVIIDEPYKLHIHAGNCGPLPSANGYVFPYTSTLEGSRVMFMCQDDAQSELTAVCTGAGKWEPSPIDVCDTSSKLNNKRNSQVYSYRTTCNVQSAKSLRSQNYRILGYFRSKII